ncbi:hypothetical protein GCM10011492_34390 [Flexivirga endophytica]|uniref:ABM domain-containing protein n=1 Tax=Flexivirga endophytica TaxID=1849103 RepID=A0A916WXS0_9MICO|nr:hypothetical protein [Flexivirga endophytica]GGB40710.1 hypothetical protein GCM10011492_34390 [Flexivirga endophytica]
MTIFQAIRYTTHPADIAENERLVRAVYDELADSAPEGFRYATLRLGDSTFLHLAAADGEPPLPSLTAFQEFRAELPRRVEAPPQRDDVLMVGNYRLL